MQFDHSPGKVAELLWLDYGHKRTAALATDAALRRKEC